MADPQLLQDRENVVARFKIEVMFGKVRTWMKCIGAIQIFESGAALHGGGDCKIYWCGYDDCGRHMPYSSKTAGAPFCEHCHRTLKSSELVGEKFFNCPVKQVAEMIALIFRDLESDADIYLKFHPTDIRRATLDYVGEDRAVQLGKARAGQQRPVIYPLKNILKDCPDGVDLARKFQAFLEA